MTAHLVYQSLQLGQLAFELGALLRRLSLLHQELLEAGGEMVGPVSFGIGADPFTVRPLSFGVDPFALLDDELKNQLSEGREMGSPECREMGR